MLLFLIALNLDLCQQPTGYQTNSHIVGKARTSPATHSKVSVLV